MRWRLCERPSPIRRELVELVKLGKLVKLFKLGEDAKLSEFLNLLNLAIWLTGPLAYRLTG